MTYQQNYPPQGGYAPQPQQGGYAPQGQYQPQGQGQQQGGQNRNSGYDNYAHITVVGRTTKDPESKLVGNSKVASTKIAVNHRSEKAGTDFWFVEVWGNEGADSKHNFLINHVPKGRKVMVVGTPELRQQKNNDGTYSYFPTIKAVEVLGLDNPNGGQGGQQGGGQPQQQQYQQPQPQQQQYQQPQQQYGQPQGQPQGGYPPAPQQGGFPPNAPGGFPPAPMGGPVGAPAGAPNNGGFPPAPPQQ